MSRLRNFCRRWPLEAQSLSKLWPALPTSALGRPCTSSASFNAPRPRQDLKHIAEIVRIGSLIRAFRSRGHLVASLDPLGRQLGPLSDGLEQANAGPPSNAEDLYHLIKDFPKLNLEIVGLKGMDLKKRFFLGDHLRIARATQLFWTLPEVVDLLRSSYCGTVSAEYMHLPSKATKEWMQMQMEQPQSADHHTPAQKRAILYRLLYADHLERFFAAKFPAAKRFDIAGCESLIPGLHALLQRAAEAGVENVELGMTHRGRLNVLHTLLQKSLGTIITEFQSGTKQYLHVGDVKYHLGTRESLNVGDHSIQVSLSPNPSHLETVDAVVVGKTKAKQFFKGDRGRQRVLGLLLHGDAAFSGLGIAAEVMQLSDLPEYTTGGTIHVIINNQIGFTTDPKLARSSPHPSDVAKGVGAPIFHVNADDPEAVVRIFQLALDFRQRFHRDVVIDVVGYRRHGHNEQDDPRVTQPLTYQRIAQHPTALELYSTALIAEGIVSEEVVEGWRAKVLQQFDEEFEKAASFVPSPQEWLASNWQGEALGSMSLRRHIMSTGVPFETLTQVGLKASEIPDGFRAHPDVVRLQAARRRMVETGQGVDWAMAEVLAFGSFLLPHNPSLAQTAESNPTHPVRLSGQDCERGTFNQRHAVLYDQETSHRYVPLSNLAPSQQAPFRVCNSSLSEAAVLGFEYGFSLDNENALVMWEAQFGDFANNAQMIVDNLIACGEDKWMTPTNLVLLLPHGFDGQGPDHSSARPERFLQLCNDDGDYVPGRGPVHKADMEAGFKAADTENKGYLTRSDLVRFMEKYRGLSTEQAEGTVQDLDVLKSDRIARPDWEHFMAKWMRLNAEKDHNLFVVNVTTPANYFHVLRRQVNRPYSKPLVVLSPKFLLHHRACTSALKDMAKGTYFRRVIADQEVGDNLRGTNSALVPHEKIRRVILCSGQIYYLLAHARRGRGTWDVALVRLEQLAPFPYDRVASVLNRYSKAELCWVQEEPKNMGAWTYIQPRLRTAIRELCQVSEAIEERQSRNFDVRYIGRLPAASAATGSFEIHQDETKRIIEEALAPG